MKTKIFILSFILFITSCTRISDERAPESESLPLEEPPISSSETITTTTIIEEKIPETVHFLAVGDNLIHSPIYNGAKMRAKENEEYDFSFSYRNVADMIKSADLAMINQETLICNDTIPPSNYPYFNSPNALGEYMIEIGFDIFTLANNHTLDQGVDGLSSCLDFWESKDVITAGAYRNIDDKNNIRISEKNGIKFSFLSYTESLNGHFIPKDSDLIVTDMSDFDEIISDIKTAKMLSDVCVVALHWGEENSSVITDYQREKAKILSEAGADIIIGNHPHVLRNIEIIERENGSETITAYSLGNFISAQNIGKNLIGGILEFDITLSEQSEKYPVFSNIKLTPIVTHYNYNYSEVEIYFVSDYTRERANTHGVNSQDNFSYELITETIKSSISSDYLY